MRIFLAGATGAIGRPLLDRLLPEGHAVVALTRSPERAAGLREHGVDGIVGDALDAEAVRTAIIDARPDVVINQLTALPARIPPRRYGPAMAATNRLRAETGPVIAAAARAAGARRLVAQSVAFLLRPEGDWVKDETAPLWTDAPAPFTETVAAVTALEGAVLNADEVEGVVLRYGWLYGPGTTFAPDGHLAGEIQRRRFPVVGDGSGCFSFVHIDDAASATVATLETGAPGVYHVTDDEPVAAHNWIPGMARALGAPAPRRVPVWLASLAAGPLARWAATQRGAANAKARRELGWAPAHPTWREGFPAVFGNDAG